MGFWPDNILQLFIEVAFYTVSTVKKSDLHTGRKVLSLHTLFMIPGIFACA